MPYYSSPNTFNWSVVFRLKCLIILPYREMLLECSKYHQFECCISAVNTILSCHIETLLECSKHLQLECCIRFVNAIISCHIETLLGCSKHDQLECCIRVVNAILAKHYKSAPNTFNCSGVLAL